MCSGSEMLGEVVSSGVDGPGKIVGLETLVSSGLGIGLGLVLGLGLLLFDLLDSDGETRSSILVCRRLICSCKLLMETAATFASLALVLMSKFARSVWEVRQAIVNCVGLVVGVWTIILCY